MSAQDPDALEHGSDAAEADDGPHRLPAEPPPARVLVLAARPADVALGCGGTLYEWSQAGTRIVTVVALSGPHPGPGSAGRQEGAAGAALAADAALEGLGCDLPRYWRAPAIRLNYDEGTIERILKLIGSAGADLVLAPSPHHAESDRLLLALAAREAVRRAQKGCMLAGYWVGPGPRPAAMEGRALTGAAVAAKHAALSHFSEPGAPDSGARATPAPVEVEDLEIHPAAELIEPVPGLWHHRPAGLAVADQDRPLVSILARTTGREELATTLDSIAGQTYPRLEVVLIDALGGGDLLLECSRAPVPVTLVSKAQPLERSRAANAGLAAASGTYITFLDDDDWLLPDHIERLVDAVARSATAAAAYTGVECRQRDTAGNWQVVGVYNMPHDPQRLIVDNYLPIHSVLFERRLVGQALQFDERFDVYEDWDFWLQLSALTSLEHVDRITAVYRISATSGFGLQDGGAAARDAYQAIITKWHPHWSAQQLVALARDAAAQRGADAGGIAEAKIRVLQAKADAREAENRDLQRHLDQRSEDLTRLEGTLRETEQRLERAVATSQETEQRLEHAVATSHRTEERVAHAATQAQTQDEQLAALEESVRVCESQIAHLLDDQAAKARHLSDLGQSLQEADQSRQGLETALTERSHAIDELRQALQQQERHAGELRQMRDAALRRLDQIQTSAAWRVSHPLRLLETRRPGLARKLTALPRVLWWALTFRLPSRLRIHRLATRIIAAGLYDSGWYVAHNPDVALSGQNPLVHWITTGWKEGRNPHPGFDTSWYLAQNPEVAALGMNPLEHYLTRGVFQGCLPHAQAQSGQDRDRLGSPRPAPHPAGERSAGAGDAFANLYHRSLSAATRSGDNDEYEVDLEGASPPEALSVRAIAFYLPQFHPIPENDAWWGEGFTEWMNVVRAVPQFVGHDQPRLPGALGFYDLRAEEVQRAQMEMARKYGIHGFCYHYYWFGGKRLLERPLQQVLDDPSLDLPFCVCWANENWTRRWDGEDQEVLIGQDHSPEDDLALFAELEPLLADTRYITVGGRPLVLVYRPQTLPDARATAERWRGYAKSRGLPDPYLAAVHSFSEPTDPRSIGFDAAVEFPPHQYPRVDASGRLSLLNPGFSGYLLDYEACVTEARRRRSERQPFDLYPGVMAAWDNTARRQGHATVFTGAAPDAYAEWLRAASERALAFDEPDRRMVFINAWNEWAEGTYLEPDRRFGYAYLRRTRQILEGVSGTYPRREPGPAGAEASGGFPRAVLFVGHDAHAHGAQLILLNLAAVCSQDFGLRVVVWLLEGGALAEAYGRVAEVHVGEPSPKTRRWLGGLRRRGVACAITNTVVSGSAIPQLAAGGFTVVSLVHEMPELIRERGLEASAENLTAHSDRIVFPAETVRKAFTTVAELPAEKGVILPQGIYQSLRAEPDARASVEQELGLPPDAVLVVNAGYADRRKGFDWFLDCARWVAERDPRFHFLWLGNLAPEYQERFEHERRRGRLVTHLHRIPFTEDIARYLAAADVFLLTSREDPFPSVVTEALASGLPVVAFDGSGGHCELLQDDALGGLAEPFGDTEALAAVLREVVSADEAHPEKRDARIRTATERFDFRRYAWNLLRLAYPELQTVSVVVPNYNYARHLEERLDSIFEQGYPVLEVIVLDDASVDDSTAVAHRTAAKHRRRIRLIENRENSGSVFKQWAKGIREAEGDLLWIAEADDVAEPRFLERLVGRVDMGREVRFAFSDSAQIDERGRRLGRSYASYCNELSDLDFSCDFELPSAEFLARGLAVKNSILNVSAVLFVRQHLLEALDLVETDLPNWTIAGDWRLYIELCRSGGCVCYLAQALNLHRRHDQSVVGANGLEAHIAEATEIQRTAREVANLSPAVLERQSAYLESLESRVRSMAPATAKA